MKKLSMKQLDAILDDLRAGIPHPELTFKPVSKQSLVIGKVYAVYSFPELNFAIKFYGNAENGDVLFTFKRANQFCELTLKNKTKVIPFCKDGGLDFYEPVIK